MKRIISLLLAALLMFAVTACDSENSTGNNDGNAAQGETNQNGDLSQEETVNSPYQVTKEQWEAALEFGENGQTLLAALSNRTSHIISESGMESVYKIVSEENLYYVNSMSFEREYYYARKGDTVDVYTNDANGCVLMAGQDWEGQKLNATDNLEYNISYFAIAYDYDNATFSEEENAYVYSRDSEVKIYFEDGKLVSLTLINNRGEKSEYSDFGTTEITLPTEYEEIK